MTTTKKKPQRHRPALLGEAPKNTPFENLDKMIDPSLLKRPGNRPYMGKPVDRSRFEETLPWLPPSPMSWSGDGLDHINIHSDAKTWLGQDLDFCAPTKIEHSQLGVFASISGFILYIKSEVPQEKYRYFSGKRHIFESVVRAPNLISRIPNYYAVVMEAMYFRIQQDFPLAKALKELRLPIDCYQELPSGIRERRRHANWMLRGLDEIRSALLEIRVPNFTRLLDAGGKSTDLTALSQPIVDRLRAKTAVTEAAATPQKPDPKPQSKGKGRRHADPRPPRGQTPSVIVMDDAGLIPEVGIPAGEQAIIAAAHGIDRVPQSGEGVGNHHDHLEACISPAEPPVLLDESTKRLAEVLNAPGSDSREVRIHDPENVFVVGQELTGSVSFDELHKLAGDAKVKLPNTEYQATFHSERRGALDTCQGHASVFPEGSQESEIERLLSASRSSTQASEPESSVDVPSADEAAFLAQPVESVSAEPVTASDGSVPA